MNVVIDKMPLDLKKRIARLEAVVTAAQGKEAHSTANRVFVFARAYKERMLGRPLTPEEDVALREEMGRENDVDIFQQLFEERTKATWKE